MHTLSRLTAHWSARGLGNHSSLTRAGRLDRVLTWPLSLGRACIWVHRVRLGLELGMGKWRQGRQWKVTRGETQGAAS